MDKSIYSIIGLDRMRIIFLSLFISLFLIPLGVKAQTTDSPFILGKGEVYRAKIERHYDDVSPQMDWELSKVLETLPTYVTRDTTKAKISFSTFLANQTGVRAPYEGKSLISGKLSASGNLDFKTKGRLRGYLNLNLGRENRIGYSALRQVDYYHPYIIADTSGGDFHYEHYIAGGLYALRRGNSEVGVGIHFAGEIAYKYEDPRVYNTTGTLQASIGYKHYFKETQLSATLHTLYHRKYMHLWLWRPAQQDKFPLTYGFGMVDVQNTRTFFGTSRMHYIGGGGIDILFQNKRKDSFNPYYTLLLSYQFYGLRTEEASSIGLFSHHSHQLRLFANTLWRNWQLAGEGGLLFRPGREYIYASYQPDKDHLTIVDKRVIGSKSYYRMLEYYAHLKASCRVRLSACQSLDFSLGGRFYATEETYTKNSNQIASKSLLPWMGGAYSYGTRFYSSLSLAYRIPLSYEYKIERGYKDQLDYQLAYLPLLARYKQGFEWRWRNQLFFTLPRQDKLLLLMDLFFMPESLPDKRPLYEGKPTMISPIFSHPERIPLCSYSLGGALTISYCF